MTRFPPQSYPVAVPTPLPSSAELAACADQDCPCCCGTGVAKGFGIVGSKCPCVATCAYCGAYLPLSDYDEGEPRKYDGMPACQGCREQFSNEDDAKAAGMGL